MILIKKMNERVETAKQDSDTAMFLQLMYAGEQLLKLTTAGLVSGISTSKGGKDNGQYPLCYELVRADGLGTWGKVLESLLTGPSAHFLSADFNPFKNDLTVKVENPSWQYGAMSSLISCLKVLNSDSEDLGQKTQLKNWFTLFARLRNDARAHGVITSEQAGKICIHLEKSLKLIYDNFSLLQTPWVFVKQNMSGSYRFTALSSFSNRIDIQNQIDTATPPDGMYLCLSNLHNIRLIESSIDATDFFFPNGNFTDKTYECLSYISGLKFSANSSYYLAPPGPLPKSETEGLAELDALKETFTNLPMPQSIYIERKQLEGELERILSFPDKYPIVTLSGRGGIGKTSLALRVLHKICGMTRFSAVVWLSGRDIDLLEEGPKTVKPQILDENDIAREFSRLLLPNITTNKGFNDRTFIQNFLRDANTSMLGPILLVMDNFETLRNPKQVYTWLDTYVRNPNKILITSRLRDFKADYPIAVEGMNRQEFDELVDQVSVKLAIRDRLSQPFVEELFRESDGHPYVVKILLGEVSKGKGVTNIKRIVASKDEILTALFERTYTDLAAGSKRIFLTLCSWRNLFPEVAIQAVLNREENELIDIEEGIEELSRYSFIEMVYAEGGDAFISVPLAAFEFGKKKLGVSPLRSRIKLDIELLSYFGVTNYSEVDKGVRPKIEMFFKGITVAMKAGRFHFEKCDPILQFICRRYPDSWLMLYRIYSELNKPKKIIEGLQNYVMDPRVVGIKKVSGLELLAKQYSLIDDHTAEAQTLVDICSVEEVDFVDLSNSVQSLMQLFKEKKTKLKKDEMLLMLSSVADKMKGRIEKEGSANDFTELAWAYLHLENRKNAKQLVERAIQKDPGNLHLTTLKKILKINYSKPRKSL